MHPTLSIVIPVFNSEDNLQELTKQIHESLEGILSFEIIYINDGSTDLSWKVIKSLYHIYPNVVGLSLMKNSGQDNAIIAGLNNAKGEYIVIMDDDLQHAPKDIIKLYNGCKDGFHVCYANFESKKQAGWKNFGSWLNGKTAEILIDKPKDIYLSPFQIIKREVVDEIIKYKGPYPYIQGIILNITQNVTQVDVEHHERYKGKSNFNFVRSVRVFLHLATSFSIIPLRLAIYIGVFFSLLSFCLIPYYIFLHYFDDFKVPGFTTIIILLLMIGGLILTSLGIIGEYIGRMYLTINQKPQYIIGDKINNN